MSSQIVLVPYGGLCNRLRAISGAYTIARKHNVPLKVCWRNNNECKADFDELFADVKLDGIEIEPMALHQIALFKSRWINGWLPQMLRKLKFDREIILFSWKQRDIADSYDFAKGRTYIYSCYSMTEHYPLSEMFVPREDIMSRINALTAHFSENTIGVHIRRTDHIKAMAACSVEDYEAEMERQANADANVKFFLATDDAAVKHRLETKFAGRIITQQTRLSRSDSEGMLGSVVDLWALAATKKIIGSFGSSYSELAAELGGIEMVLPSRG